MVYWAHESLHVAAGGFSGNARLLLGPNDSAWVFDDEDGSLTHIGALPGDEQRHSIEYNPFAPHVYRPVWLSGRRFLFVGYRYSYIVDLDEGTRLNPNFAFSLPHNSPMGLCSLNEATVVAASGDYQSHLTTVDRISVEGMATELIAKVRGAAYAFDLVTTKGGHLFLLFMDIGDSGQAPPAIVRLDGLR